MRVLEASRWWAHLRANFIAASTDSVPELQKKTRSPKERSTSIRASLACGSVWYRFETWIRRAAWVVIAPTSSGSLCPNALTAMPLTRSR